jgi:hypothetical protein
MGGSASLTGWASMEHTQQYMIYPKLLCQLARLLRLVAVLYHEFPQPRVHAKVKASHRTGLSAS